MKSMNKTLISGLVAAMLIGQVVGCTGMTTREKHTAVGATLGAIGGAALTGGSTAGVVGGAVVGGFIGHELD